MNIHEYLCKMYELEGLILENQSSKQKFKKVSGLKTGFSITEDEIEYFLKYKNDFKSPKIFIIGNAFGYSTFALYKIFENASIDVIDAEVEGRDNQYGSKITNSIIEKNKFDIKLTIGFSPEDVSKAMRYQYYDIVFIDGLHTNEQVLKDFEAIKNRVNPEKFICFFHDVGYCNLDQSLESILSNYSDNCYQTIVKLPSHLSFSGMGILSKNQNIIKD